MPQSRYRHRATALAIGLIFGTPLLMASPASAGPADDGPSTANPGAVGLVESGQQVTFSGSGLLSVSCAANPSTGSVTVAAESSLRVVNRTGHRATLLLDGAARGEVPKGSTAEVLFHRGPVTLALKPHCVLAQEKTVRVQVVPQARPTDGEAPVGVGTPFGAPSGVSSPDGGEDSGANSGSGRPGGSSATGDTRTRSAAAPPGAEPTGSAAGSPTATGTRGPGHTPASGDVLPLPDSSQAAPADLGGTVDGDQGLAAEPLSAVEPMTDNGPTGLLALIAIVCVLGVIAGAIRAIVAQRTTRARYA